MTKCKFQYIDLDVYLFVCLILIQIKQKTLKHYLFTPPNKKQKV